MAYSQVAVALFVIYVHYRNERTDREKFLEEMVIQPSQETKCSHVTQSDLVMMMCNVLGVSFVLSTDMLGALLTAFPALLRPPCVSRAQQTVEQASSVQQSM